MPLNSIAPSSMPHLESMDDQPRRSKSRRIKTSFGYYFITSLSELNDVNEIFDQFICLHILEEEPKIL